MSLKTKVLIIIIGAIWGIFSLFLYFQLTDLAHSSGQTVNSFLYNVGSYNQDIQRNEINWTIAAKIIMLPFFLSFPIGTTFLGFIWVGLCPILIGILIVYILAKIYLKFKNNIFVK